MGHCRYSLQGAPGWSSDRLGEPSGRDASQPRGERPPPFWLRQAQRGNRKVPGGGGHGIVGARRPPLQAHGRQS
eukprot:13452138-Alexandrium_andersonii.AAC.1